MLRGQASSPKRSRITAQDCLHYKKVEEPLSNLDPKLRPHVREEIRQIQQRLGLTALCVTHHQEEAMAVSDRIIVMKEAEIA